MENKNCYRYTHTTSTTTPFFNKIFKKFKRCAEFQVIVYQWSAQLPKRKNTYKYKQVTTSDNPV